MGKRAMRTERRVDQQRTESKVDGTKADARSSGKEKVNGVLTMRNKRKDNEGGYLEGVTEGQA
jgi:hypothetical protein